MQRHRRALTGLTNWSVMQHKLIAPLKLQPELGPLPESFHSCQISGLPLTGECRPSMCSFMMVARVLL